MRWKRSAMLVMTLAAVMLIGGSTPSDISQNKNNTDLCHLFKTEFQYANDPHRRLKREAVDLILDVLGLDWPEEKSSRLYRKTSVGVVSPNRKYCLLMHTIFGEWGPSGDARYCLVDSTGKILWFRKGKAFEHPRVSDSGHSLLISCVRDQDNLWRVKLDFVDSYGKISGTFRSQHLHVHNFQHSNLGEVYDFFPDGNKFVITLNLRRPGTQSWHGYENAALYCLDLSGKLEWEFYLAAFMPRALRFSPDGDRLVVAGTLGQGFSLCEPREVVYLFSNEGRMVGKYRITGHRFSYGSISLGEDSLIYVENDTRQVIDTQSGEYIRWVPPEVPVAIADSVEFVMKDEYTSWPVPKGAMDEAILALTSYLEAMTEAERCKAFVNLNTLQRGKVRFAKPWKRYSMGREALHFYKTSDEVNPVEFNASQCYDFPVLGEEGFVGTIAVQRNLRRGGTKVNDRLGDYFHSGSSRDDRLYNLMITLREVYKSNKGVEPVVLHMAGETFIVIIDDDCTDYISPCHYDTPVLFYWYSLEGVPYVLPLDFAASLLKARITRASQLPSVHRVGRSAR